MLKNVIDQTTKSPSKGLNTNHDILGIEQDQSPNMMNVLIDFDGSASKRLGSNTQNALIIANSVASGFSPNTTNLTNNLVSYWPLDEASGTRFDINSSNNLTDNNNVSQSGGIKNQASLFASNSSQYLLINNNASLQTGGNFALAAWIYLNSTSTTIQRVIVSKQDLNGTNIITSFTSTQTGQVAFGLNSGGDILRDAQSFQIASTQTISSASVYIKQGNGSPGQITVRIETDNAGAPSGTLADANATGTIEEASVLADFSFIDVTFAGTFSLAASTTYWLVAKRTTETGANAYYFMGQVDAGGYANGVASQYQATAWVSLAPADFLFKVFNTTTSTEREYSLFVNTDNVATFSISSSGTAFNGQVSASSFGALNTSTWYNIVAWHNTAGHIGISVNLAFNSGAYTDGVRAGSAPFVVGAVSNGAGNFFDGRIDEVGFWKTFLTTGNMVDLYNSGSGNTIQTAFGLDPWASFDFGATGTRWLTVAAGTGLYASSNLGVTFVNIATTRTATYQFLQRSKNVLVATSDAYDAPLFWAGSSGTYAAILNSNATATKYSINFNGFLFLMNSSLRKRGMFYEDENTQLTGTWASNFDIPSTQDDEITAGFILRRYLYVSTKYYIYRVSYLGGNPDFSYLPIKDWGFVPRTVKPIYVDGVGQVMLGMSWDNKLRLFDGSDDKIISGPVEEFNGQCQFAMDNINTTGSGQVVSFAETNYNDNVYKLCVAVGQGTAQTTHMLNYDGRSKAYYPYDKMLFNTMTMANSGGVQYLMAFDRSGYCHMMDSGNLDGNTSAIDEVLDSSLKFDKSPSQAKKAYQTDLFFSNETCGTIHYFDRIDFQNKWNLKESFVISGSDQLFQIHKSIDVPESYNMYQYRLTSSMGTLAPWRLNRDDHFSKNLGIGKGN